MSLESGTFIDDLDVTNPPTTDPKSQGDDHLRLIKEVLKNTFPNANKPQRFPDGDGGSDGDVFTDDNWDNFTWFADTGPGEITIHLHTPTYYGFRFYAVKASTSTNPMFIVSGASNIFSGGHGPFSKIRRCIPNAITTFFWDGGNWRVTRVPGVPIGTILPWAANDAPPIGYEPAEGQGLDPGSYPEWGEVVDDDVPDLRGRVIAARDAGAGRLTGASGGVGGNWGDTGGNERHTLSVGELAQHSHTGTTSSDGDHSHTYNEAITPQAKPASAGTAPPVASQVSNTSTTGAHTHNFTTTDAGSNDSHNNVQPTIVLNYIVVVE